MPVTTAAKLDGHLDTGVTMVHFEGTMMPLDELGGCTRYILHECASALDMMGEQMKDDAETRITYAIKLAYAKIYSSDPDSIRRHRPTQETRQAAAGTFRTFIMKGGDHRELLAG